MPAILRIIEEIYCRLKMLKFKNYLYFSKKKK